MAQKGEGVKDKMGQDYMTSTLMLENSELKKRIRDVEQKNMELSQMIKSNMNGNSQKPGSSDPTDLQEIMNLKQVIAAARRIPTITREGPYGQHNETLEEY